MRKCLYDSNYGDMSVEEAELQEIIEAYEEITSENDSDYGDMSVEEAELQGAIEAYEEILSETDFD